MNHWKTISAFLAILAGAVSGGCVWPGGADHGLMGQYQRAMARRGPQRRGSRGADQLRASTAVRPPLKVVRDEQTGKVRIFLSLDEAIMRTLANSMDIRVVSFDPAVSRQEMVKAAAEFDYVVFGRWDYDRADTEPASVFASGEVRTRTYEAGIQQDTITGAQWRLSWSMTQTLDDSTFSTLNEQWDNRIVLELAQPLLRDAWPEVNLAGVKIARLSHTADMQAFRQRVEEIVTEVISAYWALIQARRDRQIQQELLDRTIETRQRIDKRRAMDATEVEFMQSQAAVETRRASLIRSETIVSDAQDRLVRLLGDSQLNLLTDCEVVPTTRPNVELVRVDQADQLLAALRHNPLLAQARTAVEVSAVNVAVARNGMLPRLDLSASVTADGLDSTPHEAREDLETGDFVGYNISLRAEYPIGNRQRIAEYRAQRLARLKAIATMQNTADLVAQQVRQQIRQIATTYQEMKAQQRAVEASRNQLEALEATEELRPLSPEFLQVKLAAQEDLANAQRAELAAVVNYNIALAELARAAGTILELHRVRIAMPSVLGLHRPGGP